MLLTKPSIAPLIIIGSMEAQAPICPYCCDDHSSLNECEERELKKVILKNELKILVDDLSNEKIKRFERMIDWL